MVFSKYTSIESKQSLQHVIRPRPKILWLSFKALYELPPNCSFFTFMPKPYTSNWSSNNPLNTLHKCPPLFIVYSFIQMGFLTTDPELSPNWLPFKSKYDLNNIAIIRHKSCPVWGHSLTQHRHQITKKWVAPSNMPYAWNLGWSRGTNGLNYTER